MNIKKIGILTGGGDCPGLNAVIRAVTKSAIHLHGWEVVGFLDGFQGLVENWNLHLTSDMVSGILTRGGTLLGTNNRADPFAYYGGPRRIKVSGPPVDRSKDALLNLQRNGVDALVITGGDGTLSIAQRFSELGIPVIGVPKTIDNDLGGTDVTFGFDSALTVATEAVDRLHSTAESHHRIMVVEVMGRYAGWIGLRSGIAGGGDVLLIPEIPYEVPKIIEYIESRYSHGKEFTIVVASEGAKPKGGAPFVKKIVEGSAEPIRLGGIGNSIAEELEEKTDIESRVTVLGHLQRGGSPTAFDRLLATRYGVKATDLIARREFGEMVSLRGTAIASVPIKEAVLNPRRVDPQGEEVAAARATGVTFGD